MTREPTDGEAAEPASPAELWHEQDRLELVLHRMVYDPDVTAVEIGAAEDRWRAARIAALEARQTITKPEGNDDG